MRIDHPMDNAGFPETMTGVAAQASQPATRTQSAPSAPASDDVQLSPEAQEAQHAALALPGHESLDEKEQAQVDTMRRREQEVVAHEAAHMAAGGGWVTGGPSYSYETGPDGRQYIVGGEVQISTSAESTPEATIRKMEQVQQAALAPADPSPQDRAVAAAASQQEMRARAELTKEKSGPVESPENPSAQSKPTESRHPLEI